MKNTQYQFGNSQSITEYLVDETVKDNWALNVIKILAVTIGFAFAYALPIACMRQEETATRNEWVRRDEETPEEEAERKAQARKDRAEYMKQYFKDHPIHNN